MSDDGQASSPIGQLSGKIIGGRYRLGDLLGQGGMGVVYTATQESLARTVALKVLQPMLAQNGEMILRFKAEAERAGRLAHPHIVQILDFGHEEGASAWIAMELLSGEPLSARIERGTLSEAEVVCVARETLSALEAAHAAHLVHRDLKPDNIFLANVPGIGASVKVLDFGIAKLLDDEAAAKLTATGMLIGTPLYMAPEQARGDDVDQRADLYALGAVCYEALTGRPPFTGKNYNALLFSVLSETPQPIETFRPDISPALSRIIARAMAKDPAERWQSAHEMAEALRAMQPGEQGPMVRAASDPAMATAPTMATPIPNGAGAPTPVMGGAGTPQGAATAAVPLAATPSGPIAQPVASPAPLAPPARDVRAQNGFRLWPIALAGGALAMATLAFLGGHMMSSQGSSSAPVAHAGGEPSNAIATVKSSSSTPTPTPVTPTEAPMVPAAGTTTPPPKPHPVTPVGPTGRAEDHADHDTPQPAHGTAPRRRDHPRRYPRPRVTYGGGSFGRGTHPDDFRGPVEAEGGWADCWPRTVPIPTVNQGRDFEIDVAGNGAVLDARPEPNNGDPPQFAECVVKKLRHIHFPPTGKRSVRVDFSVRP